MSVQNEVQDFPQNSRRAKKVVIMNMGNSIALDLYRFQILAVKLMMRNTWSS